MLPKKAWSEYRVLIVNDDGIDAKGIKALDAFAREFFGEVFVVAPTHEHSGTARAISHRKTMNLHKIDETHFSLEGTPTDCAIVALHHILKGRAPDLVLSGINHGANTGNFVTYSGTFGGAFEAGLEGYPAISLSQRRNENGDVDLLEAIKFLPKILDYLRTISWPKHVVMNVNFPDVFQLEDETPVMVPMRHRSVVRGLIVGETSEGTEAVKIDLFQNDVDEGQGQDVDVLVQGRVSITPMQTNWTCFSTLLK